MRRGTAADGCDEAYSAEGAVEGAEKGLFEAVTGGLKAAAGGITVAIGWGYLIAVIFNPKSVR